MKCIIVEDEIAAQRILTDYISRVHELKCIGIFESCLDIPITVLGEIDLVFLDIQLPEITGLEFIKTLEKSPNIIITSAYASFALESYEIEAIDYLLKPFSFHRFLSVINRFLAKKTSIDKNEDYVFFYADKTFHNIKIENILFLKAEVDYVKVVSKKNDILVLDSLNNVKNKLPKATFIQVHRSFVISIKNINQIKGNRIHIENFQIPISKKYKESVQKLILS